MHYIRLFDEHIETALMIQSYFSILQMTVLVNHCKRLDLESD
jgi:hypothetical protein